MLGRRSLNKQRATRRARTGLQPGPNVQEGSDEILIQQPCLEERLAFRFTARQAIVAERLLREQYLTERHLIALSALIAGQFDGNGL